jgi:DNA-binding NarL/FixJ family response regulator
MIKKRIFIACMDERLRIAMLLLLEHQPNMVVVGITDRLQGLVSQLDAAQPDALLLEWELPLQKTADLINDIQNLEFPPEIIFLSNKQDEKENMISAGADHFILKDAPPDALLPILNNTNHLKQDYLARDT